MSSILPISVVSSPVPFTVRPSQVRGKFFVRPYCYTLSVLDFRDNYRLIYGYGTGHWPKRGVLPILLETVEFLDIERHFPVKEEEKISTNEGLMVLEEAIILSDRSKCKQLS